MPQTISIHTSHHPHGWCGLKSSWILTLLKLFCHHPHGWCGLKLTTSSIDFIKSESHHPHGWCGLKFSHNAENWLDTCGHHPHGWCGLKYNNAFLPLSKVKSPPTRVVWIEIRNVRKIRKNIRVTTHTGGVDWNFKENCIHRISGGHHPHGWCGLKSSCPRSTYNLQLVTTHTGGVDWNPKLKPHIWPRY